MKPEIILKLLKLTKSTKKSAGFTLIELLVAAIITSIIVSIAGWGLVTLMSSKKVADTQTAMQGETNRAADFINDEIRRAERIETDTSTANLTAVAANFTPGSSTVVLALQIPDVNQRVIYYVENSSDPWRGPKVIGRWGPALDSNGKYTNATNPTAWQKEVLIDRIASNNVSPTCATGETQKNAPGFAACVTTTTASIYVNGEFKKPGDTYYSTGSSKTDTKAVSRINTAPADSIDVFDFFSGSPGEDMGARFQCKVNVPWRMRTTITIGKKPGPPAVPGKDFVHEDRQPIPSLRSLLQDDALSDRGIKIYREGLYNTSTNTINPDGIPSDGNGNGIIDLMWRDKDNDEGKIQIQVQPYVIVDENGNGGNYVQTENGVEVVRDRNDGSIVTKVGSNRKIAQNVLAHSSFSDITSANTNCDNNATAGGVDTDNIANNKVATFSQGNPANFTNTRPNDPNNAATPNNNTTTFAGVNTNNLTNGFSNSDSTATVLQNRGYMTSGSNNSGTYTTTTYTTSLSNNEIVFMFENGQTSQSSTGFDLQDKMIKLTW
jgi:prepilin-type N-terminal cleavage/methylation domain-containing protein